MEKRSGEKIGWTAGFLGGFIWVAALSVLFFIQGEALKGALGLLITSGAVASVIFFSPWRHPLTRAWKLMLVPYLLFAASIVWSVMAYGGFEKLGLNWWNCLWLFPMLLPFWTGGCRKWTDGEAGAKREGDG